MFKKVFEKIYESEINCRLEWRWNGGFTWTIQDNSFPRIWKDDNLDGKKKCLTITSSDEVKEKMKNFYLEKDWIDRGVSDTVDGAFYDMITSIEKHFPNSKFAAWVKDYNKNMEHFMICVGCGDLVDKRNLSEVLEHEHGNPIPIIDKTKKYIVQQKGDNKVWLDGNPIDLN
jgi:hypothetical protein